MVLLETNLNILSSTRSSHGSEATNYIVLNVKEHSRIKHERGQHLAPMIQDGIAASKRKKTFLLTLSWQNRVESSKGRECEERVERRGGIRHRCSSYMIITSNCQKIHDQILK
jgi:hypothetical protein